MKNEERKNETKAQGRMVVYLSAPVTGRPLELVRIKFEEMRIAVGRHHDVVCPLDLTEDCESDYAACMGRDVEALLRCDAVYFARGWQTSRGCRAELALAQIYGKTVLFE